MGILHHYRILVKTIGRGRNSSKIWKILHKLTVSIEPLPCTWYNPPMKKIWFEPAERNRITAKDMLDNKHYNWSLFVWHLSLEKLLKGIVAQNSDEVPFIHNLSKIATQTSIKFTDEQLDQLDEITTFNLEARYDDYKYDFYKKATAEYSNKWHKICEELYLWIMQHKK